MSEATKDKGSDNESIRDVDEEPSAPTDQDAPRLSIEEVERVASQFTPAWEVAQEPPTPAGQDDGETTPAAQPLNEGSQDTGATDETQPPQTALAMDQVDAAPSEEISEEQNTSEQRIEEQEDNGQDQGPIDIVADIPKRTEVEIKDEPSVVVADDEPPPAEQTPRTVAVQPAPTLPISDGDKRSRNKLIVMGVVAFAALVFIVGGIRALLLATETKPTPTTAESTESITSPEALPMVTAIPPPSDDLDPLEPTTPEEPIAEDKVVEEPPVKAETAEAKKVAPKPAETAAAETTAAKTADPKPAKTTEPVKTAEPKPAETTAPAKTAEPKPPKKTPPADKPPSGGIVRETPF